MVDEVDIAGNEADQLDHVLQKDNDDFWDIEETLRDGTEIKIRVKEMTTRDGLLYNQLQLDIMKRMGVKKKSLNADLEVMTLVQHYPLMRFGTDATVGIDVPTSEEMFWKVPEYISLLWSEAVIEANPQYGIPFTEVRRILSHLTQNPAEKQSNT